MSESMALLSHRSNLNINSGIINSIVGSQMVDSNYCINVCACQKTCLKILSIEARLHKKYKN